MADLTLLYALDLAGTAAFAFSGALRALDRRPDFVGMTILAGATALGGGIVRDAIFGQPAGMLRDVNYGLVIMASATIAFLFPWLLRQKESFFMYFDAVGLGVFSAIGATLAWNRGLDPISLVFVASLTGAGGGMIRDVLLGRMPVVLYREVYISAVVAGAMALAAARWGGLDEWAAFIIGMCITMTIRVLAIARGWSLPRVKTRKDKDNGQ